MRRGILLCLLSAVPAVCPAQWVQTNGPLGGYVASLAVSGTTVFAGVNRGVYRSTDNGVSWSAVNSGLGSSFVRALAVSGSRLFAGFDGAGVFLSTDNGTSWNAVNTGLPNVRVLSVVASGTFLFAGTYGGGSFSPPTMERAGMRSITA